MIRLVFLSIVLFAGAAALTWLIQKDAGYIMIVIGGKVIEMRFWVAIAFVLGVLLSAFIIYKLCTGSFSAISSAFSWAFGRNQKKAEAKTKSGMIHYIEGDWIKAKKDLLSAAKNTHSPTLQYLFAAQSAHALGKSGEARILLQKAEAQEGDSPLVIAISQARMQVADKEYESALATLNYARTLEKNNPAILSLLKETHVHMADWRALEALLPALMRQKIIDANEKQQLEKQLYRELLLDAGKNQFTIDEKTPDFKPALPEDIWLAVPKALKQDEEIIEVYTRLLIEGNQHDKAEQLLKKTLNKHWNTLLVETYGSVKSSYPLQQLETCEKWIKQHSNDAVLYLCAGRIAIRVEQWEKAREYFEKSLAALPSPAAYAELARLLAFLGLHQESIKLYQRSLSLADHSKPNEIFSLQDTQPTLIESK